MRSPLFIGIILSLFLSGCASYHRTVVDGGVAFPLPYCWEPQEQSDEVPMRVAVAKQKLTLVDTPLIFSSDWVCRTAPVTKPKETASRQLSSTFSRVAEIQVSVPNESATEAKTRENKIALVSSEEEILRRELEAAFVKDEAGRPSFGVALSGGGSKAAAVTSGVMAGLADEDLLDSSNYISSVSGGSYAAYFYYSHRVFPKTRGREEMSSQDMYRDCIRNDGPAFASKDVRTKIDKFGSCNKWHLEPATTAPDNKYQAFLRCQQDMFRPGKCSTDVTSSHKGGVSFKAIFSSIALFPSAIVASGLFDWGVNTAPSARTYQDGIGVGYGTTVTDVQRLKGANNYKTISIQCDTDNGGFAYDCKNNLWWAQPIPMEFEELSKTLLDSRKANARPMPFWIINAVAPKYRSELGWFTLGNPENTNSDIFEMTAVSHGSGRYGYVSAPMSLHNMTVLDAVGASAAFLDSNQLEYQNFLIRGVLGVTLRVANLDWGVDIGNYNVSDGRRKFHRAVPFPFYYLDGAYDKYFAIGAGYPEMQDRVRSSFIRLIDGGNGENLGAYALIKRKVRTIVVADAAGDKTGSFKDMCGLMRRVKDSPEGYAKYLYIPGLANFENHCANLESGSKTGYDIRLWPFSFPILVGCLRIQSASTKNPCDNLGQEDTRLLIVKPAFNIKNVLQTQFDPPYEGKGPLMKETTRKILDCVVPGVDPLPRSDSSNVPLLNCETTAFVFRNFEVTDGKCQIFPQNATVNMTANSSASLFGAYRELSRQYIWQAGPLLKRLKDAPLKNDPEFEIIAQQQGAQAIKTSSTKCDAHDSTWLQSPVTQMISQ